MMADHNMTCMFGHYLAPDVTQWTRIVGYPIDDEDERRRLRDDLYRCYANPVYWFIVRRGKRPQDAEDLTHEFFNRIVWHQRSKGKNEGLDMIEIARPPAGWTPGRSPWEPRFRYFLLEALRRFLGGLPAPAVPVVHPPTLDHGKRPRGGTTPEEAFHIEFVSKLLDDVIAEVQEWYCSRGKVEHWRIFWAWVCQRKQLGGSANWEEIRREVGFGPGRAPLRRAQAKCYRVKKKFRELLRARLRPLVASEDDIDPELRELADLVGCASEDSGG